MENELFILESAAPVCEGAPKQFQILPLGLVHSQKGDFLVDNESFVSIQRDFKARGLQIPVDYEHQTLHDMQAPAAGWIKELVLKSDGVFANVDWTSKAAKYLADKEYKYCSPVILVRPTDHRALKLHSVALTNKPAIDAMIPIVNSDKLNDTATSPTGSADQPGTVTDLGALATILQLPETATLEEIYRAVSNLIHGKAESTLRSDAMKFEMYKQQVDAAIEQAFSEGKITPPQKDWAYRSAMTDLDEFYVWLKGALPVVPMGQLVTPNLPRCGASRSDELLGLSRDDIRKFSKDRASGR